MHSSSRIVGVVAAAAAGLLALEGSARAEDPLDSEGAPRYVISVDSVRIDRTANWPSWFNVIEHSERTWGSYSYRNWYSGWAIPNPTRKPAKPYAFDSVRDTSRLG